MEVTDSKPLEKSIEATPCHQPIIQSGPKVPFPSPKDKLGKQESKNSMKDSDSGISRDQSEPDGSVYSVNRSKSFSESSDKVTSDVLKISLQGEPKDDFTRDTLTHESEELGKDTPLCNIQPPPQHGQENPPDEAEPRLPEHYDATLIVRQNGVPVLSADRRTIWMECETLLECSLCELLFRDEFIWYIHVQAHGPMDPLQCLCGIEHDTVNDFNLHIYKIPHVLRPISPDSQLPRQLLDEEEEEDTTGGVSGMPQSQTGPQTSKGSSLQPDDDPIASSSSGSMEKPGPPQSEALSSTLPLSCDLVVPSIPKCYRNWDLAEDVNSRWFGNWDDLYECLWCEILYRSNCLYHLHKRAHGPNACFQPFVCICGQHRSAHRHTFNLHLYLHAHS